MSQGVYLGSVGIILSSGDKDVSVHAALANNIHNGSFGLH